MIYDFIIKNDYLKTAEIYAGNSGSKNVYTCRFEIDGEYRSFIWFCVFRSEENAYLQKLADNECTVPYEILKTGGSVQIGCYATDTDGGKRVSTNWVNLYINEGAYCDATAPEVPAADVWETLVSKTVPVIGENGNWFLYDLTLEKYVDSGKPSRGIQGEQGIQGVKGDRGDRGEQGIQGDRGEQGIQGVQGIQGERGPQGDKGDKGDTGAQGEKGDKGDSPVRGTDYWTDEDKAEISADLDSKLAGKADKTDIDALKRQSIPHTTAGGYPLSITDSLAGESLTGCWIWGNTDGVGDLSTADNKYHVPVKLCGKNLLDSFGYSAKSIVTSSTDRFLTNRYGTVISTIEPENTITVTQTEIGNPDTFYSYTNGYFLIGINKELYGKSVKFVCDIEVTDNPLNVTRFGISPCGANLKLVTPENGKITCSIDISASIAKQEIEFLVCGCSMVISNIMVVEEGETDTVYEPYITPAAAEAVLDASLAPGEYIDIIRKKRINGDAETDITVTGEVKTADSSVNRVICDTTVAPEKIEVEYYQDINKVLTELKNAILAQGGNT